MTADDHRFMARAIRLARKGIYTAHPNPRVGCVLVRAGRIVGEGYHRRAGEAHAERNALNAAGENARGATAYVTLEPCCHHGRTPPCTDGLIKGGVSRVVAAMQDPNPRVAGKGMDALRQAGVQVTSGLMSAQAAELNPGFIKRMRQGRPFVRVKLAMSLDGGTAMASGESKWITGEASRCDVQRLRARSDAIITGIGTVLADDPSLNVRIAAAELHAGEDDFSVAQPQRVVLDPQLLMPAQAKMLKLSGATLVVCSGWSETRAEALQQAGAEVVKLAGGTEQVDLASVLDLLARRQINEVLIEAGQVLAGALLSAGLVDQLVIYAAPHVMGKDARGLFDLPGVRQMRQRIELSIMDLRMVGKDIRILAVPSG